MNPLFLLSPAKKLNETPMVDPIRMPPEPLFFPEQASMVADQLKLLPINDLAQLMSLSESLATLNHARHQHLEPSYVTTRFAKEALFLFNGDAYEGLDAPSLNHDEKSYLNEHLLILSGLYGLLRPDHRIQPYRLEMGSPLKIGTNPNLYGFWKPILTQHLDNTIKTHHHTHLINLASKEYSAALDFPALSIPVITPHFLDKKESGYKIISFYAKRARGLMMRWAAQHVSQQSISCEYLKAFPLENYRFDPDRSTDQAWFFIRD